MRRAGRLGPARWVLCLAAAFVVTAWYACRWAVSVASYVAAAVLAWLASAAAMDGHTVRVYRAPAVHALSGRPA